mmetsp:Transcript_67312/g.194704  ORF Transcript_67312/g.194704 Transcript_67312/m.194704 type:complete len:234 (-) Transcript_67312:2-703(-)
MSLSQLHVICVLVMDSMGPLPGIVGHQEQTVKHISDGILDCLVLRESTVTTFMSQHPQSHSNGTSHRRIGCPERQSQNVFRRKDAQQTGSDQRANRRSDHRYAQVSQRSHGIRFKAVRRNHSTQLASFGKVLILPSKSFSIQTRQSDSSHIKFLILLLFGGWRCRDSSGINGYRIASADRRKCRLGRCLEGGYRRRGGQHGNGCSKPHRSNKRKFLGAMEINYLLLGGQQRNP